MNKDLRQALHTALAEKLDSVILADVAMEVFEGPLTVELMPTELALDFGGSLKLIALNDKGEIANSDNCDMLFTDLFRAEVPGVEPNSIVSVELPPLDFCNPEVFKYKLTLLPLVPKLFGLLAQSPKFNRGTLSIDTSCPVRESVERVINDPKFQIASITRDFSDAHSANGDPLEVNLAIKLMLKQ